MAVEGIIIELGSTDQIDVDIGSTEHIEGGPGEAKFLPGPQGPQGAKGDKGDKGDTGTAATIAVGNVSSGASASVTNTGTSSAAVFDFVLPKGDKGDTGEKGDTGDTGSAATIAVGNVSKGENASVTNSGTSSTAVFDFVLPKGDKGDTGDTGATGATGTSVTGVSVARTSGTGAAGTTDTYTGTVSFSNGTSTTFTFNVYNGADGQGTGDMLKSVYDTDNDGVVDDAEKLGGQAPAYYAKATNGIYYAKTAGNGIAQVATIPGITQYYDGLCVALIFNVSTRRDATININNLGAVPLRENTDSASATNSDSVYSPGGAMRIFVYDSANSLFRGVYDYSTYDRIHMVVTEGSNAAKQADRITQNNNYFKAPCYQLVYFAFDNTAQSALTLGLWNGPYAGSIAPIYINGEASSATNYTLPKGLYLVLWDVSKCYINTDGTLPGTQAPLTFDSTPTASSTNPVTSGGVYTALAPLRTVDSTPTDNSTNLVESGGVASAVSAVQNTVSRRNLLDNWYFANPVNQRGKTAYTGGYAIDRWKLLNNSGTLNVVSGGIQFTNTSGGYGYCTQKIENVNFNTTPCTFSLLTSTGDLYVRRVSSQMFALPSGLYFYQGASNEIAIRIPANLTAANSEIIVAMKVEIGTVQTLAHQENGVWVLNEIPHFAEELAKCQRYYWEMKASEAYALLALGMGTASNVASFKIQHPVTMRDSASVTASGTFGCNSASFASATFRNNSGAKTTNYSFIEFDTTISQGTATTLQDFGSNNATLKFSADL